MPSTTFDVSFSSPLHAQSAHAALVPEIGQAHEKRAQTTISVKKNRLAFTIDAKDESALRASQHTYSTLAHYLSSLMERRK